MAVCNEWLPTANLYIVCKKHNEKKICKIIFIPTLEPEQPITK
jgi:hypothetical protein